MPQQYQKVYAREELVELLNWFNDNRHRLPASLDLASGVTIPDLPKTVNLYFDIVSLHKENATYGAQILHLFRIREKLIEQGF